MSRQSFTTHVPWRIQLALITLTIALVAGHWMYLIHLDNVWKVAHPLDASRGMSAFSAGLSHFLHASLLMIPAVFLIRLMARNEAVYATYARFLFCISTTTPLLLAADYAAPKLFGNAIVIRLMISPFALASMGFSRLLAESAVTKKWTLRAFVLEGAGLAVAVALLFARVV